jgi:hypothetical protein
MTGSHVRVSSSVAVEAERRERPLDRPNRSTSGMGHSPRPAVVHVATGFGRSAGGRESTWRHARAVEALHSEEDRMRLVAALLVLATLLLWMLFLQG